MWQIEVLLCDKSIEVIHRRVQVNMDTRKEEDTFEFTWELQMVARLKCFSFTFKEF